MTNAIYLPSGTAISESALDLVCAVEQPTTNPGPLPAYLMDLRQNWIDADEHMQAVADDLDDGKPMSGERADKFNAAKDNLNDARDKYFTELDNWTAVPVGSHLEWLIKWGIVK